jgi:beta-lactamase class A
MKKILLLLVILLCIQGVFAQKKTKAATAKTSAPKSAPQTLDEKIQAALAGFQGKAWIYAKNLDTGKDYALRADEQTRTASTKKLAIKAETFHQDAECKQHCNDPNELTQEKKHGGSCILF